MNILGKTHAGLMLALVCAVLSGLPQSAHALIGGNLECSMPGYPSNGYRFTPGQEIDIAYTGTCTIRRAFPYAAGMNAQIAYMSGADQARLRFVDPYNNTYMLELPLGQYGGSCLGGPCRPLPLNTVVPYRYRLVGTAPRTTGRRYVQLYLGVTSHNYANWAEWFMQYPFNYTVYLPACSLSSPSSVDLSFGTISSADLSNQKQSTSVSVTCPAAVQATATLVPSQAVVSASDGVSRTTLAGLNMQARWGDNTPVNLNSPRTLQLRQGSNSLGLGFTPQLESGQSPAGAFQSQYTLTIDYR